MFVVNVAPDMGMYHLLRSQGYDPAYALAEFVDNALQAHLSAPRRGKSRTPLSIDLYVYSTDYKDAALRNSIVISDTGPGIGRNRLADAMKPAHFSGAAGLSEFGIGMKAAAVWFSDQWSLSTKPIDDETRYSLDFDLPKLLESGKDVVNVRESKSADDNGTKLVLKSLRRPLDYARFDDICKDLRDIYQRFTEGSDARLNLTAYFDGAQKSLKYDGAETLRILEAPRFKIVKPHVYAIGKPKIWNVPINTVFQGFIVTGFVCLLEEGSYTTNPGLVMFRGERVIQGTRRRPYLPANLFKTSNKYARQRVYGQLFVDGLPVSYTKDRFEIDDAAFARQIRAVDGVEELIRQAEEYRSKKKNEAKPVAKESDIPGFKRLTVTEPVKAQPPHTDLAGTPPPPVSPVPAKPAPAIPKPQPPPLVALLTELKANTTNLALRALIEETVYLHQFRRSIGTALCLRVVLELGVLDRIRRTLPTQYAKVSDKGIKALINYMNGNTAQFFDAKTDHNVIKCVQNIANSTLADVVLLNNVAHGSFQPDLQQINKIVVNIEPLFRWAFA